MSAVKPCASASSTSHEHRTRNCTMRVCPLPAAIMSAVRPSPACSSTSASAFTRTLATAT
eukprot:CAMPEP_0198222298 /NCGR_PEP_ID=MMETSP1445-20131203/87490_1 /TAXON_ID=36898 /ORGANISM="Pyramimonas sp., Strain CCMP2087" /LENGTH=59 /DNA_ID=CAMNT_0043900747 /DNA_START=83 /DNA_END=262 /DNA_ORIENTATION=-